MLPTAVPIIGFYMILPLLHTRENKAMMPGKQKKHYIHHNFSCLYLIYYWNKVLGIKVVRKCYYDGWFSSVVSGDISDIIIWVLLMLQPGPEECILCYLCVIGKMKRSAWSQSGVSIQHDIIVMEREDQDTVNTYLHLFSQAYWTSLKIIISEMLPGLKIKYCTVLPGLVSGGKWLFSSQR